MLSELTGRHLYITNKTTAAERLLNTSNWQEVLTDLSLSGRNEGIRLYYPASKPDIDMVDLLIFYEFTPEQIDIIMKNTVRTPGQDMLYCRDKNKVDDILSYSDEFVYIVSK